MIKVVHAIEKSFHLAREDRAFRLLVTVADQAIQGEGSIRFTEKERSWDGLVHDPLGASVCKFHVTDGVGTNNDKQYEETVVFDRLLRLIRRHFGWGTGNLIFRGVATKFSEFVLHFRDVEQMLLEAAATAETNGQLLAAEKMRKRASEARAEAAAITRAGWDTWKKTFGPQGRWNQKGGLPKQSPCVILRHHRPRILGFASPNAAIAGKHPCCCVGSGQHGHKEDRPEHTRDEGMAESWTHHVGHPTLGVQPWAG